MKEEEDVLRAWEGQGCKDPLSLGSSEVKVGAMSACPGEEPGRDGEMSWDQPRREAKGFGFLFWFYSSSL